MAKEKFIRGKVDKAHHDGRYSNEKRKQAAEYHLLAYLSGDVGEDDEKQPKTKERGSNA